jgi:hypothetical protein
MQPFSCPAVQTLLLAAELKYSMLAQTSFKQCAIHG